MPPKTKPRKKAKAKARASKPSAAPTAKVKPDDSLAIDQSCRFKVVVNRQWAIKHIRIQRDVSLWLASEAAEIVHQRHDLPSLIMWAYFAQAAEVFSVKYAELTASPKPPSTVEDPGVIEEGYINFIELLAIAIPFGISEHPDAIEEESLNVWSWLKEAMFYLCHITGDELHLFVHMQLGSVRNADLADKYRTTVELLYDQEEDDPGFVDGMLAELHKRFPTVAAELPRPSAHSDAQGKAKRKRRRVGIRGLTQKQKQAMDLKERGFTHAQIAEQMGLNYESLVTGFLQRGEAAKRRMEAAVRREQASGWSLRTTVSIDSREGSESDD